MAKYAADTTVSVENSRAEIERTLKRYQADAFAYSIDGRLAQIMFRIGGRMIRFRLTMPDPRAEEFHVYMRGSVRYRRDPGPAEALWEKACRQKWRALALVIKAKLEAVSANITSIEDEFLAHTILPDGQTVGEAIKPEVDRAYLTGGMPGLLLAGPSRRE